MKGRRSPGLKESSKTYMGRCPHCRTVIRHTELEGLFELKCPTCRQLLRADELDPVM